MEEQLKHMTRYINLKIKDFQRIQIIDDDGKLCEAPIVHRLRYAQVQPILVVDLDIYPEIDDRIGIELFVRRGPPRRNAIHYPTPGPMALFLSLVIQKCNEIYKNIDWFILDYKNQFRDFLKKNLISFTTDQPKFNQTGQFFSDDPTPYIKIDNDSFLTWADSVVFEYSIPGMPTAGGLRF